MTTRWLILNDADVRRALTATEWLVPIDPQPPAGTSYIIMNEDAGSSKPHLCVSGYDDGEFPDEADPWRTSPCAVGDVVYIKEYWGMGVAHIAADKMPRWAARIWREVTAVEPVRMRDLTDDSISRMGIFPSHLYTNVMRGACAGREYLCALRDYLDEHHPGAWGLNKWCWRYEWRETKAR